VGRTRRRGAWDRSGLRVVLATGIDALAVRAAPITTPYSAWRVTSQDRLGIALDTRRDDRVRERAFARDAGVVTGLVFVRVVDSIARDVALLAATPRSATLVHPVPVFRAHERAHSLADGPFVLAATTVVRLAATHERNDEHSCKNGCPHVSGEVSLRGLLELRRGCR
jgi:hypothetical protein